MSDESTPYEGIKAMLDEPERLYILLRVVRSLKTDEPEESDG